MKTKREATAAGKKLLSRMKTSGWKLRVWENMGWHYALENYGMSIHQDNPKETCSVLFSLDPEGPGGSSIWCDKKQYKDPNKAVERQMELARNYANKAVQRVHVMGAILSGEIRKA